MQNSKLQSTIAFGLGFVAGFKGVSLLTHLVYLTTIGVLLYINYGVQMDNFMKIFFACYMALTMKSCFKKLDERDKKYEKVECVNVK